VGDWRTYSLAAGYAAVAASVAGYLYAPTLAKLASLALTEEYGYLLPLAFSIAVILAHTLSEAGVGALPGPGRLLAAALYTSLSATFYTLSLYDAEFALQYRVLGLALLLSAVLVLAYRPLRPHHLMPVLALLALVPPPASWIGEVARLLAPAVARAAAAITGADYVEAGGSVFLLVEAPEGVARLEVARACTGIVSASSALAIAPLLAYFALAGSESRARRVAAAAAAVTAALAVAVAGNLARVSVMVWVAREEGVEAALGAFHFVPAPVYSAAAVVAAFLVYKRVAGHVPRPRLEFNVNPRGALAGLAAASLILLAYSAVIPAEAAHASVSVTAGGVGRVLDDPAGLVADAAGARLLASVDRDDLRWLLGSSKVVLFKVEYAGRTLTGYIEVADSIARFHAWHMCLEAQGFTVKEVFKLSDDPPLYQVRYTGGARDRILLYTIIPYEAGGGVTAYLRVSVTMQAHDVAAYKAAVYFLSSAYQALAPQAEEPQRGAQLEALIAADYALILATTAYSAAVAAARTILRL